MTIPELVLTGPDSIVASIPYIIGFTPHDSIVVMWMRDGQVTLTMRLDLPEKTSEVQSWMEAITRHRSGADDVILCVVLRTGIDVRDESDELRARVLIDGLLARLAHDRCPVRDALLVQGDRWWSYLCPEPECCPPSGRQLDHEVAAAVAARFVMAGVAPLRDREAVLETCAPRAEDQRTLQPLVELARQELDRMRSGASSDVAGLERWRDRMIASVTRGLRSGCRWRDHAAAEALTALSDVRVRDTVIWNLGCGQEADGHALFESAASLLRRAPSGVIAPIGTLTALLGWLIGDCVRARAALDRVLDEDPAYGLALLVDRSIRLGLSPQSWRQMMQSLGRETCRDGASRSGAQDGVALPG